MCVSITMITITIIIMLITILAWPTVPQRGTREGGTDPLF